MEARITIITLGVRDFKRAYQFYTTGLGFQTDAKDTDDIAFLKTNGTILALYPLEKFAEEIPGYGMERGEFSGITLAHNVSEKAAVDRILNEAEAAGGRIVKSATDIFWGGYSGYFTDTDGYHWEVAWAPFFEYDEHGHLVLQAPPE